MRNQPVPLVTGFYADQDRPFSQQDVWNYLPCRAEKQGARSPLMLKTPPGLYPWLELEGAPPVRGIHDCEGRLFAVIGSTLYRLSPKGVAVPIGTIPGNGRVSMDHNQRANGQQLTVVNGSAGYVYDTHTEVFERITDSGFPGSPIVRFMDGYMLGLDPAGRFAFSSGAANALDYNTLDRWTSEYRPDRLVSMARLGGELLLLSANSGEFFGNTGAAQQPFRSKRIFLDKGCAGPHTVVEADNNVFWLGSDGYFYQLDGYNSRRISTRPIEQAIRGQDWWNAFAFVWESEGHTVVYWTFLDGQTWGWDTSQQEWHRRESYGLKRWRPNCTARSNGAWYAGDFQKGRIWRLDWGYPWEGDTEFVSGFTLPVIHDNQNELVHSRLELVMDVGQVEVPAAAFATQPVGPSISGEAPDAYIDSPYTFTYSVAAGDSPISRTIIVSGSLLPGLSWDQATATISGTPTEAGTMTLLLKVIDLNGLWAELEDVIHVHDVPEEIVDGFRNIEWNLPCGAIYDTNFCYTSNSEDSFTLTGDGSKTFTVKLAIYGDVETRQYTGGEVMDYPHFYKGGTPTSLKNRHNIYTLTISNPPQVYHMNHSDSSDVLERIQFNGQVIEVQIASDATVSMKADTIDGGEVAPSQWMRAEVVPVST